jgi:F0F1-type ATP synthase assembly protein I
MDNNDKKVSIWKSAYIKVFTEISAWIVGPVLISALIGNYLDKKFNSAPWILGVALGLSFTVSMIMIVRIAKKYEKNLDKENKDGNK